MIVRIRLVVPRELVSLVARWGEPEVTGALAWIGPFDLDEADLPPVLACMTSLSADWLRRHPEAPRLADVGRYEREPPGDSALWGAGPDGQPRAENDYLSAPLTLGYYSAEYAAHVGHRPYTDCEDVSICDAAEEHMKGRTWVTPVLLCVSPTMRHVVTRLGTGLRDMSRILIAKESARPWNP